MTKEAALIIGLIASVVAAAIEQLSGPGIVVNGQPAQTALNVLTILVPLIAGAFTRYQVYSKQTVAELTGTSTDSLPPPP